MKLLQRNCIFFFVLLAATSFSTASTNTAEPTNVSSIDESKEGVFVRQEAAGAAAGTLLKDVGQKIQSGAANFVKGVEHFVVGVLGAINNVNIQQQIDGIVPDDEKTTTEEVEEEETTPATTTTTTKSTTKRTTKRTTMRRVRTKPTTTKIPLNIEEEEEAVEEATTDRKVFSRKPGYKLKPKVTSTVPSVEDVQVVENQSQVTGKPEENLKTKITSAPTVQQQQQVVPQIQYVLIPNFQSLYQPGQPIYQQPIYQPIPIQQQQPIRTQQIPNNNNIQQNGQPLKSNEAAIASPSLPAVSSVVQPISVPVNAPLNQGLPQSEPIFLVLPQQLQPQAQPLIPIQSLVQQQQQQQQAVVETTSTVPSTTTTTKATTESTKPPSKLQQFSLNRKPSLSRTPKPNEVNQVNIPFGTVLRPKEPENPKRPQVQQRPGLVLLQGQVPTPAPDSNVALGGGEVEGNAVSPGEETGEVVTEEGNEERTEAPEETENTDTENETAAAA